MTGTLAQPTACTTLLRLADTRHVDALLEAADLLMNHALLEKHASQATRGSDAEHSAGCEEKSNRYVSHAIALQHVATAFIQAGAKPSAQATD